MADNGGGGGGNAPDEEPVDDDVIRDAAPDADGDAHAHGAVGEVEIVTRVEQPLAIAIGIVSKSLSVAQMKNAGTAALGDAESYACGVRGSAPAARSGDGRRTADCKL